MEEFYALNVKGIWQHFKTEHFSFWMICGYLFIEYVRPQSILPWLDFLPWAQLFVLGALVGWLADPKKTWVSSPINKWMVLFFISILLSSWFAYIPELSFSNLENFYTWMIIYFLIINIVNTRKRFFIFLFIFLVASFKISFGLARVWAMRGFAFTGWGLQGPPGFFQNSGELAIQMAVFWPLALAVAISLRPYITRWKYGLLMAMPVTAGMVILGASSRGGQLALAGQFLLKYWRTVFRPKSLLLAIAVASAAWLLLPEAQKERFTQVGDDKTSEQRLLYWEHGLGMLRDHPLTGVGYFNFIPYYERYHTNDMLYPTAELPHNIFLQVGADLGWLGLVPYLALIVGAMMVARRTRIHAQQQARDELFANLARAMNFSFVGFLVAGQFVSVVYYPFMWIHLAFLVALNNISFKNTDYEKY